MAPAGEFSSTREESDPSSSYCREHSRLVDREDPRMSSVREIARKVIVDRPRAPRPPFALGAGLIAVIGLLGALAHHVTNRYWGDLAIYRFVGQLGLHGQPLYGFVTPAGLTWDYPPFTALPFMPLAFLSLDATVFVWTVSSLVALGVVIWLTLQQTGVRDTTRRAWLTLLVGIAALPLYPVSGHLVVGQIDVFIVLLVLGDMFGRPDSRWRGLGVGLAAGLKLTPVIFIGYLLLTRRWRAAAVASATFAATIAAGFLYLPGNSRAYWLDGLFLRSSRVAFDPRTVHNQSLRGALARLLDTATPPTWLWLGLVLVVGVGGLALAVRANRRGEQTLGVLACALTGLLVSPVSWHHHWIWCVPAMIFLATLGWRARWGVAALWVMCTASTLWVVITLTGHDLHFSGFALVYDNAYVLVGLALLVVLGRHLRKGIRE
jgi:alpha-1,2-mannosyltransferase